MWLARALSVVESERKEDSSHVSPEESKETSPKVPQHFPEEQYE